MIELNDSIRTNYVETKLDKRKVADVINTALADISGAGLGGKAGASIGAKVGLCLGNPITGAVTGAAVGGLVGAAVASWAANEATKAGGVPGLHYDEYISICERAVCTIDTVDENITSGNTEAINVDDDILSNTKLSDEQKLVGKLHNVVLGTLNGSIVMGTQSEAVLNDYVLVHSILMDDDMRNVYDTVLLNVSKGDFLLNGSVSDYVLKLFEEIMTTCGDDCEDISTIINLYQDVLQKSTEIPQIEKDCLGMAFSTALYSFNYWSKSSN